MGVRIMRHILILLSLFMAPLAVPAAAEMPQGQVVLTIVGAVEKTNRGPFDPFDDALAKAHDVTFQRAYAFDRELLEALGTKTLSVQYAGWPKRCRLMR